MQLPMLFASLALAACAMADKGDGIAVWKPEKGDELIVGHLTWVDWNKDATGSDNKVMEIELLGGKDPGTLQPCGKVVSVPINNVGRMHWDLSDYDVNGAKWECPAWERLNENVFGLRFTFKDNEKAYSEDFKIIR